MRRTGRGHARLCLVPGLLFLLFLAAACAGQSTDRWETATPGSVGLDSALLAQLGQDAAAGAFPNIHAVLVARHGRLVLEEYYNGFDRETRQYTASVSKSVGSILLGIAIDQGLVPPVHAAGGDAPLSELLPEYDDRLATPAKRGLTLRHVLTMSAGLEWDEQSFPYDDQRNDWIRASRSGDPIAFVLDRRVVAEPGTVFNYNGAFALVPAYLIERGTGAGTDRYAEQHLFSPLGIADYEWERLPNGMTDTAGGLHLRPRDMAKLGQLYLDGGVWGGSRVVSESWVRASVQEHTVTEGQPNYGYLWWCGDFHYVGRSTFTFLASGHGGQKIYVFPELDMVVVLTHAVFDNPMGELHNGAILGRYILPAADRAARWREVLPLDSAALDRYVGAYGPPESRFTIAYREGALVGTADGSPPLELTPYAETRFRGTVLDLVDVAVDFEPAADGTGQAVRVRYMFNDRTYRRVNER
jgi:CubicO group peptidase (beta-lactamase class C family)